MIPISSRTRELQSGDVLDGRYRILGKLAGGGTGTVLLAEHMLIRRRVAIKLLHFELATDCWMMRRFLNEAAAAGSLRHAHVVESTDMGFTRDGIPYIVFEHLEGCLVSEEIRRLGRLPLERALVIARQIASALEAAHSAQIAHLDVKSDNVFLIYQGGTLDHAKLIDFGLSRFTSAARERTPSGILLGTPESMAPEQVADPDAADCRADIYALGVLLYEMLAGHPPFGGDDFQAVLHRVAHDAPPVLDVPVPPALERLLFDGMLAKSRDRRLQTVGEVAAVLDAVLAATTPEIPGAPMFHDVPAKPEGTTERTTESTTEPPPHEAGIWHDRDLRGLLGDKYDRLGAALRRRLARHAPPARLTSR